MYYDVVPNMATLEDRLGVGQFIGYVLAILVSFSHLPFALADVRQRLWRQALLRLALFICPLIIFFGTDGLIAHSLWWAPISDTDRFHLLHHSLFAGAPLLLGYWLIVHLWWQPTTFTTTTISRQSTLISGMVLASVLIGAGVLMGTTTLSFFGGAMLIGLLGLLVVWR
jgi:hypothetical protein